MGGLAPGTVLARRFRVLKRLGEGGMGSVYQIEDLRRPGTVWALKELLDDATLPASERAWANKRFDDEIALLATLRHPRIPRFVERFDEGGRRYFVMEFVPGETLEERLDRAHGPLPERDVLTWMIAVCDALSYLHRQRPPVIVRDLKPGNIMVTPTGDVRLIDFGIARIYKPGKASNTENLGTAIYASPEHHGSGQTDARSDIYSLGASMYHLLTNSEPDPMATPAAGSLRRYAPNLSAATEQVVIRAMRLPPGDRFQAADKLRRALQASLRALPQPTAPTAASALAPTRRAPTAPVPAAPIAPPRAAPTRTAATAANRRCSQCGHLNRPTARFCARDGVALSPLPARESAAVTRIVAAPSTAALQASRASQAFDAGRYPQAIRQGEEAIAQGHATADTYLVLGRAYRATGRPVDAARVFEEAARRRPAALPLLLAAAAYQDANNPDAAQVALVRARALDPRNPDIPYQLGMLCRRQHQLAQAEGDLRDALALRPDHAASLAALRELMAERVGHADASDHAQNAPTTNPPATHTYQAIGHVPRRDPDDDSRRPRSQS